jgi:metal-responsive CopG/Arc/MetJ family transcriptional regulator
MATRGENNSTHLTNEFAVVRPVRRVNIDLTQGMLRELDERAAKLNISRQALIETPLRQAMDQDRPVPPSRKRRAG